MHTHNFSPLSHTHLQYKHTLLFLVITAEFLYSSGRLVQKITFAGPNFDLYSKDTEPTTKSAKKKSLFKDFNPFPVPPAKSTFTLLWVPKG